MPVYESEEITREELEKTRKRNVCSVCGGWLNMFLDPESGKAFVACWDYLRTHHEGGIEREASKYEKEGLSSLNIPTRREIMEDELGTDKTKALAKYMGVVSLTKPQAKEILVSVYPDAPEAEITRAVILCSSCGLNPLMKHVFLIPFNKGKPNESWATVIGIKAKRLLASRRGSFSYVDDTPKVMTEEVQKRIFGEVYKDKLMVIVKVKDPVTGAEAPGYGSWPIDTEPYGTEKGNNKFNMAAIRAESQALDRLRPGEMPMGVEVAPEEFIEGEFKDVTEETGEEPKAKEHWCQEHNCAFMLKKSRYGQFYAHKKAEGGWCNEKKKEEAVAPATEAVSESAEAESEAGVEESQQPKRDPDTIKTLNDLFKACDQDFKNAKGEGMQPDEVVTELGVGSQSDISDTPADCYRQIAKVR